MASLAVCLRDVVIKVIVKACICFNLGLSLDFADSVEVKEKATVQTKYYSCVILVPQSTHVVLM